MRSTSSWLTLGLAGWLSVAAPGAAQTQDRPPILKIEWREGPEYPMGIQDSVMGVLSGQLISAGGFTRHPKDVVKKFPDAFRGRPHGFTRLAFRLDLAQEKAGWMRLADIPGPPRQGAAMAVVDDRLYAIGGFNYTAPWTYREVYRLQQREAKWLWEKLPCDLPWSICEAGTAVIGKKIYLVGGADYFRPAGAKAEDFHSEANREGRPVGRALLALDTTNLKAGWQRLPDHPGLGLFDCAVAAAGGKIYLLGGVFSPAKTMQPQYYNAVDSWVYSVAAKTWKRLPDMPHGSNRRAVCYKDRFILLVAGYKYGKTWRLDGTQINVYSPEEKKRDWRRFFEKTVLVYDTQTDRLTRVEPLNEQTSWPMLALSGNKLFCLGGEGGRLWHPARLQIGTITGK